MHEFNHHYQQLPNFLQSELLSYVGSQQGLSLVQILARHIAAADHWIAKKNAHYKYVPDRFNRFGDGPLNKQHMEELKRLVDPKLGPQGRAGLMLAGWKSRLTRESIRCLTHFKHSLLPIQARAQAEEAARWHAQHQAQEAARQLAQRQAEEAARQLAQRQAEEAARERARQQAQAAARELARRQAEEAARQLAGQQAEAAALSVIRPRMVDIAVRQLLEQIKATLGADNLLPVAQPSSSGVISVTGPKAMATAMNNLLAEAERTIRGAIADYSQAIGPGLEAFSAMLYAFKQNGLDTQRMGEAALQP